MFYQFINRFIIYIVPYLPVSFIRMFAGRYVAGETARQALKIVRELNNKGYSATLDILGEHSENKVDALDVTQEYTDLYGYILSHNLNCNISIKPTHIGLDIEEECAQNNLNTLLKTARETNNFLRIDMENSPYTDASIKMYLEALIHYQNVGPVIQAYLHRSPDDICSLNGEKLNVRICKGIYKESETIALNNKSDINDQYVDLVKAILNGGGYAGIATHDLTLINALDEWIIENQISPDRFEFQILYGVPMAGRLEELLEKGYKVRQYVPYGEEWFEYSVRRLKENPVIITYVFKNMFKSR